MVVEKGDRCFILLGLKERKNKIMRRWLFMLLTATFFVVILIRFLIVQLVNVNGPFLSPKEKETSVAGTKMFVHQQTTLNEQTTSSGLTLARSDGPKKEGRTSDLNHAVRSGDFNQTIVHKWLDKYDPVKMAKAMNFYMLWDGKLYAPQGQILFQRRSPIYRSRDVFFEQMILEAWKNVRYKIAVGPIPVFYNQNDWVGCEANTRYHTKHGLIFFSWVMSTREQPCRTFALPSYELWDIVSRNVNPLSEKTPWHKKLSKVGWRGSTTGKSPNTTADWRDAPRIQMVRLTKQHPDLFDVGFFRPSAQHGEFRNEIAQEVGPYVPKMDLSSFDRYQGLLDITGNSWSVRIGRLLCMNSVVLRVDRDLIAYYESELEPWIHYVPVLSNFSDLVENTRFVLNPSNQEQVHKIIRNANEWCRSRITHLRFLSDVEEKLVEYAGLVVADDYDEAFWKRRLLNSTQFKWEEVNK